MVPRGLRRWFVIHFVVDFLFAVPLLVAPGVILRLFGWTTVEPVTARLVGAALMGIGVQSLLGRDDGAEAFRAMLNLKIIWSSSAVLALALSIIDGAPPMAWAFLALFAAFNLVWVRYRLLLRA